MSNPSQQTAIKMPSAVEIQIQGIPAVFVDVPLTGTPIELSFTRMGELVPFQRGALAAGVAILVLPPEVAQTIRTAYAQQIAAQRAAAAAGGH